MKFLFSVLAISLCIACGKATDEATKDGEGKGGKFGVVSANSCILSSDRDELPNGGRHEILDLYPQYVGVYDQSLYIVGTWPSNYPINREGEYKTPTRQQLLKSKKWKWMLGPVHNKSTGRNELAIWKEIFHTDGEAYFIDFQEVNYGTWEYFDDDTDLVIECNIPAK